MALKPWYKVVTPREDLREGKPLDASEFAVHLDKVRVGTAPPDYRDADRFFERTYLTETLCGLGGGRLCAGWQVRRLRPQQFSIWRRSSGAERHMRSHFFITLLRMVQNPVCGAMCRRF